MSKKFLMITIIVVLGSLVFGNVALAQTPTPPAQTNPDVLRMLAQVTAVDQSQLSVKDRQGNEFAFTIDSKTKLRALGNGIVKPADLAVGQWVLVQSAPSGQNQWVARGVLALPQGFDPSIKMDVRAAGKVIAVDATGGTFTLQTLRQGKLILRADASTKYFGVIKSLDQLKPDMRLAVGAQKQAAGNPLAILIIAQNRLTRNLGSITSVDLAANKFSIHTFFTNQDFTFTVNPDTRFNNKGSSIQGLKDLQPGMVVAVSSQEQAGGEALARGVLAGGQRFQLQSTPATPVG